MKKKIRIIIGIIVILFLGVFLGIVTFKNQNSTHINSYEDLLKTISKIKSYKIVISSNYHNQEITITGFSSKTLSINSFEASIYTNNVEIENTKIHYDFDYTQNKAMQKLYLEGDTYQTEEIANIDTKEKLEMIDSTNFLSFLASFFERETMNCFEDKCVYILKEEEKSKFNNLLGFISLQLLWDDLEKIPFLEMRYQVDFKKQELQKVTVLSENQEILNIDFSDFRQS